MPALVPAPSTTHGAALRWIPQAAVSGRGRARQARTALLTGLVTFAGLLLAAAVFFDIGPKRDPLYSGRLERLFEQTHAAPQPSSTIAILGSSRTREGVRANDLHELLTRDLNRPVAVANFGFNGCGPTTHLLTWNRLRRDGARPDLVVIEVLPAKLNANVDNGELSELQLPLCRVRRCDLPIIEKYFDDVRPALRREWWLAWPNTLYTYRLALVSRVAPNLLPFEQRVLPTEMPEDQPTTAAKWSATERAKALAFARGGFESGLQNFRLGGCGCAHLRELLASVQRDGVPVVLVVMPEGPVFRSWYAPGAFEQVQEYLKHLSSEFAVPLIDAHDWMTEADFFDSHHLTQEGAAKFTRRFGEEYLVPIIQGHYEIPTTGQRSAVQ